MNTFTHVLGATHKFREFEMIDKNVFDFFLGYIIRKTGLENLTLSRHVEVKRIKGQV